MVVSLDFQPPSMGHSICAQIKEAAEQISAPRISDDFLLVCARDRSLEILASLMVCSNGDLVARGDKGESGGQQSLLVEISHPE